MENLVGYEITEDNVVFLHHLTGKTLDVLRANIGWVAYYDERQYPRWQIAPRDVVQDNRPDITILED